MLLTSRFSQAMCGVVISRDGDAERHSRRPVRAHLEYIVTAVKSEDVRDLEAHPEKLKDYVASLDRRADVQRSNYPLGVVATDHAGYCSFDLEPFQVAIHAASLPAREGFDALKFIRNFWIEPLGAAPVNIFDLENLQVTPEGLLAYLSLPGFVLPPGWAAITLPSMQTPRLIDWRFSAGSFVTNPGLLIGADGCETMLPAQVTLRTFRFSQIVRFKDIHIGLQINDRSGVDSGPVSKSARLGVALEYRTDWYQLGHSLGQILYSQPLAPCESVKLAVINWSRQDDIQREDKQTVTENLLHEQHRDRIIEETVDATLREHQSGGSFMAGLGLAGKAAASSSTVGAGVLSIGGATASSNGTRALAGNSVQKLTDTITQATSVKRDLYGTVVIQANQAEQNTLETRAFTNNNHCHALTILYYEVLRHLRVVTRWTATRPVILIDHELINFSDEANIRKYRRVLEAGLLETRLAPCFDAADKLLCLQVEQEAIAKSGTADLSFFEFHAEWLTGANDESHSSVWYSLVLKDGSVIRLNRFPNPGGDPAVHQGYPYTGSKGAFADSYLRPPAGIILYSGIAAIRVEFFGSDLRRNDGSWVGGDWILGAFRLKGRHAGGEHTIFDGVLNAKLGVGWASPSGENNQQADIFDIPIASPSAHVNLISGRANYIDLPDPERCCLARLKEHLMAHQYYYSRLVWLTGDPNERADLFDQITVSQGGGTLLDFIDNRPIEVLGHAVAFPVIEEYWNTISGNHGAWLKELLKPPRDAVSEALLTIPTRGVFAEAKLGHCNSCEEIDDTRYWQWQESPCPCDAPDISDVSPGPRGEAPKVDQSTMPSPVVNIVNPAAAPDPTGLAGALKLLGTSNIFRDMSMATELGSLLNTLAQQSAGLLKPAEASKNDAKSTGASGQATGGGDAGKQTSARQPTVTPRTGQTTDKLIKATGASQATKSQALDQNVRNMVGLPTPLEAPRHFNFDVKWWQGGPDMSATFEVIVKDHNNIEYPLGPYTVLDGLFSATLPDALWQGYTDAGSISGVRLIARDAVCPARSLKLDLPALATDKPAIQFTQPLSIPVVQQSMFTAPQLVGKTNAISKAAGNPLRFSAVAARKEVQISVKATLQGTGELMLEAATNIAGKIAEVIGLQAGVTDTLSGELALGLALKGAPKIAVGASGEVQLPITVEYLDHTTLNLTPVIDSK